MDYFVFKFCSATRILLMHITDAKIIVLKASNIEITSQFSNYGHHNYNILIFSTILCHIILVFFTLNEKQISHSITMLYTTRYNFNAIVTWQLKKLGFKRWVIGHSEASVVRNTNCSTLTVRLGNSQDQNLSRSGSIKHTFYYFLHANRLCKLCEGCEISTNTSQLVNKYEQF